MKSGHELVSWVNTINWYHESMLWVCAWGRLRKDATYMECPVCKGWENLEMIWKCWMYGKSCHDSCYCKQQCDFVTWLWENGCGMSQSNTCWWDLSWSTTKYSWNELLRTYAIYKLQFSSGKIKMKLFWLFHSALSHGELVNAMLQLMMKCCKIFGSEEGRNGFLHRFQQLRSYCEEIETRNWEEFPFT